MDILIKPFNGWTYNLVGDAAPIPLSTENRIYYACISVKIPTKLIKCRNQINVIHLDDINSMIELLIPQPFIYEIDELGKKLLPENTKSLLNSLIHEITLNDELIEFNIVESFN